MLYFDMLGVIFSFSMDIYVLDVMVKCGLAKVWRCIKDQKTQLMYDACYYELIEVLKFLVTCGLTPQDIRSNDNCAIKSASSNGRLDVVKFLVDQGLTLQDIRSENNYALRWASTYGHLDVVKFLVSHGAQL